MTAQEWLTQHGINEHSIKRYHIDWDENQVNIPIKNKDDKIIWIKHRNLKYDPDDPESKKYINDAGSKVSLFNIRSHYDKKNIILTEGEIDAIRLDQENIPAISNTGGAETFNKELAEQLADKNIYIVYDNDEAGKKGIRKVLEFLPNAKILELPLDSHDVCDYFTLHNKTDFINLIKQSLIKEEWEIKYQSSKYNTHTLTQLLEREYPEEGWIIEKFLPTEGIVLFSGDAGVGKSFIALEIVRTMVENDLFLDHFQIKTPNIPILVIDKENGSRRLQKRIKGIDIPSTDKVHFLEYPEKFTLEDKDFMQAIQNCIIVNKIGIVTLDSLIDILVGDENSAPDTAAVFNALRSIAPDILWVIFHHEAKPVPRFQKTIIDRARGSSNIKAQVDYLFSLQRTKDPKVINIEQGKARDYEMMKPFAVEFITTEEGEMGGFKYLGEVKDELSKVIEAADFIMNFLGLNPYQSRQAIIDLAESQNIKKSSIERAIAMLKEKQLLDCKSEGRKKLYFILIPEEPKENRNEILEERSESKKFLEDNTVYIEPSQ